jgi:hypothetical protein
VQVKLHKPSAQSTEVINRYILHIIESTRLLLRPPVDTVVGPIHAYTLISADNLDHLIRYDRLYPI